MYGYTEWENFSTFFRISVTIRKSVTKEVEEVPEGPDDREVGRIT